MPTYTKIPAVNTVFTGIGKYTRETGFLLNEDGTYLLQEDGSKILLDYSDGLVRLFKPSTNFTKILKPV